MVVVAWSKLTIFPDCHAAKECAALIAAQSGYQLYTLASLLDKLQLYENVFSKWYIEKQKHHHEAAPKFHCDNFLFCWFIFLTRMRTQIFCAYFWRIT